MEYWENLGSKLDAYASFLTEDPLTRPLQVQTPLIAVCAISDKVLLVTGELRIHDTRGTCR